LLRAGNPSKKAIAIFYDSRVGTHSEYLDKLNVKQVFARLSDYDVVLVDLAVCEDSDKAKAILS